MGKERFTKVEVEKIDEKGHEVEFTYSDIFDREEFKAIVDNPETPGEMKEKCARRLYQVEDLPGEQLNVVFEKGKH